MKKQFNLEYYLTHPETKVVTRSRRSARIICTDAKSSEPDGYNIISLVSYDSCEIVNRHKYDGTCLEGHESSSDLFFDLPDPDIKRVPLTYEDLLSRVKYFVEDKEGGDE